LGVITPTAALSSFPYTPVESMKFLHYLYDENKSLYVGLRAMTLFSAALQLGDAALFGY
jgi:hypothetical protein